MVGCIVFHNTFGSGTIISKTANLLVIDFNGTEKKFVYPDAFEKHLTSVDQGLMAQVNRDLQVKNDAPATAVLSTVQPDPISPKPQARKKLKKVERSNVAFKCNYCDGGKTSTCIGFHGVCSDAVLRYNIEKAHHVWCADTESPCRCYLDGKISRTELEDMMRGGGGLDSVCYESHMLRDWMASAGVVQTGANRGKPMRLLKVQRNSLAVLTSREPNYVSDELRFIFAVFLVDESYEGDYRDAGYVTTTSEWKISLTPQEAHQILFWNYYLNQNAPERIVFGSGLHRYLSDNQAAQILRDIAEVRTEPKDKEFAQRFFEYFCTINGIDMAQVPPPVGVFKQKK